MNCKFVMVLSLFLLIGGSEPMARATPPLSTVWDALTREFSLNHEVHHPEVQKQLKLIMKHPEAIRKMAEQSKPYLYHILSELKKRNLPGEIALIPMIESEYDPRASSNAGAAGLWQLMPETGADLGLTKNWWVDGRRSFGPSTNAALNYLTYLHHFFHGNWLLAFAAYDSGENRVKRAVKLSRKGQFWSLTLPHETKAYIPKLLALSEIIQNPKRYHVTLPAILEKPYFKEVDVSRAITLNSAAKLAEMPTQDVHRLNPGFKDWSTRPVRPYKLLLPTKHIDDFNRNFANLQKEERHHPAIKNTIASHYVIVKKGDSLSRIAHQHHIKLNALRQCNPQIKHGILKPGQQLHLP